ncbi:type II toxin-antitoxin system Phd/YefM family antitoxin [Krasilnikovia sp. M28-CT-15]|uniref:type II toxin-antitoxin system Phd/YefM family antitoxin n=1 Tax=Krasilnikovia sp. M28-CT-15 TaxID=3373540 RepID=UPI0038766FA3
MTVKLSAALTRREEGREMLGDRIDLSHARVVTMRDLNQHTSTIIDEINAAKEPAVITKHGRFVALITPLAGRQIESVVLAADPQVQEMIEEKNRREANGDASGVSLEQAEAWLQDQ